jgi:hypothetical protein
MNVYEETLYDELGQRVFVCRLPVALFRLNRKRSNR